METRSLISHNPDKHWVLPVDKKMFETLKLNNKVVDNIPLNETRPALAGRSRLQTVYFVATTFRVI